jgi:hypothetical protein
MTQTQDRPTVGLCALTPTPGATHSFAPRALMAAA